MNEDAEVRAAGGLGGKELTMRMGRNVAAALVAWSALGSGCLINSHSRTEYSGEYVSPSSYESVEVGKSKQDFVLAALGEPTCKSTLDDGGELWKWKCTRTHSGKGSVFLLLSASDKTEKEVSTCVLFRDGVVEKKWQD